MKLIFGILVVAALAGVLLLTYRPGTPRSTMTITSPAFENGKLIPRDYTCDGGDVNPELQIGNVPEHTKSLALIMDDPDAPGGTFTHWTVWNIAPTTTGIAEGQAPAGSVEGMTSFGRAGYGGPCPPHGQPHRYFFKLYALDAILNLQPGSSRKALEEEMANHILDQAGLVGLYGR